MIVKATIDGKDIYLEQNEDGTWQQISSAPAHGGIYPVTVTVQSNSGEIVIVGQEDPELGKILKLIVLGKSIAADRMIKYLPSFMRKSQFLQDLFESEGHELDRFNEDLNILSEDAYIMSASETRIKEWEQKLKIVPTGTLQQRKLFLLATIRGQGKLNESKIKMVVKAFTGGDAIITFDQSVLNVKVLSPTNGDVYLFTDVERALAQRIPGHIGLNVQRWYSSWNDIKNNFSDWNSVKAMGTWDDVKKYIPPQ